MSGFTPSNIDIIRFPVRKRIWWWSWVVHLGMVTNPLPKSRDFGDGDRFGRVGLAGRWMGALWPSYLRIQKDPKGLFGQLNSLAKDLQGGYGDVQRQDWGLLQIQFATSHTPTCNSLGLFGLLSCKSWCFHQYSSTKYWIDTDMDCIILYIYIIYYIYVILFIFYMDCIIYRVVTPVMTPVCLNLPGLWQLYARSIRPRGGALRVATRKSVRFWGTNKLLRWLSCCDKNVMFIPPKCPKMSQT